MNLFYTELERERLHHNFLAIREDTYLKKIINLWVEGFVDRDNKFVYEFQTTFNSCFWELYLHGCFKHLGFKVDFSKQSPDFCLSSNGKELCVEAVIAEKPQNGLLAEWEKMDIFNDPLKYENYMNYESIVDLATVRLMQALTSKFDKYIKDYSKLTHCKNKPFIVAVAPFEQPFFFTQNTNAIRKLLYTYDLPEYVDINGERFIYGNKKVKAIKKNEKTELPLGLFLDKKYEGISAVIFSNTATIGKARVLSDDNRFMFIASERYNDNGLDKLMQVEEKKEYHESILDGLHIFHNPNAKIPLEIDEFHHPDIANSYYDPAEEEFYTEIKHEALYYRMITRLQNGYAMSKKERERFKKEFFKEVFNYNDNKK
ncbi:hypothetical protein [Paenibacillus sp. WC2504]|uniref:hypothetical protein n=1 Tax=Paenibacillus sp. WC2504 TaxID=3461403 RepID=UPI0040453795